MTIQRRASKWLLIGAAMIASLALVPRWICGLDAGAYFDGKKATQEALARGVARRIQAHDALVIYPTQQLRFSGQSAVATYQMALLGMGQLVLSHPELRSQYLPAMQLAADRLVDPNTLRYAAEVYGRHGSDGSDGSAPGSGHAYLGYLNLGLGMLRRIDPATRHAALHDRITRSLARQLDASSNGMIETYPGESWPPDVAAVAGSIGLHALATGGDAKALLGRWAQRFERCALHKSGYLIQRLKAGSCTPADAPRGSGTAVAAYFISFAHRGLSGRLFAALQDVGTRSLFGFGAIREYAPGFEGDGDGNAGPMLFGLSVGATGFGLGAARAHGDRALFTQLYRTTALFGMPVDSAEERRFAAGGLLGDALLLAMLTARSE